MVPSFVTMKTRRLTAVRVLGALLLLAVLAYGGAMVWLVTQETRLVFQASVPVGDRRPAAPLETAGHAWLLRTSSASPNQPWVIFLHGNGATIASRLNILHYERLRELGVNV